MQQDDDKELTDIGFNRPDELEVIDRFYWAWEQAGRPLDGWWDEDPLFMEDVYSLSSVVEQARRNVKKNPTAPKPPVSEKKVTLKDL